MNIKEKTKEDGHDVMNGYDVKSLPVHMWCDLAARGIICRKRPHGERDVKGLYMTQCVRCKHMRRSSEQYDPRMAKLTAGWNMMYNILHFSITGMTGSVRYAIPDINVYGYCAPRPEWSKIIRHPPLSKWCQWHKGNNRDEVTWYPDIEISRVDQD